MTQPTPRTKHDDMNFKKPYNRLVSQDVREKARYCQDFNYYDGTGAFLREMPHKCRPKKAKVIREPLPRNPSNTERELTPREQAIKDLGNTDTIPRSIKDAREENRAAAAAEEKAD